LAEAGQDRLEERAVLRGVPHVVDGEDHDGLDAVLPEPHGRREAREVLVDEEGGRVIEVDEAVARGAGLEAGRGAGSDNEGEKTGEEAKGPGAFGGGSHGAVLF